MLDILIKNGTIIDGTGAAPMRADVAIADGRIVEIAPVEQGGAGICAEAQTVIDASARLVTPGFVDVHGHSDFSVLVNPEAESMIRQGITTEIAGNCGAGPFPLRGAALDDEADFANRVGLQIDWTTASGYMARLESAKPAINMGFFVGHGNIRGAVIGYEDRPATSGEMAAMEREVEEAMEAGALGMSTGLIYAPGLFSEPTEIIALQSVAARHGGIYSSHVRGEGDTLLEAADEFMAIVRGADCQGQFSHLKASGPANWGKVRRVVEQIEEHNSRGGRVRFDKYPYIASSTSLASLLPSWSRDGGRDRTLDRLADPAQRERMVREAADANEGRDGWDSVLICQAGHADLEKYQGKSVADVGRDLGLDAGDAFVRLLVDGRLNTSICNFTMSQDDTDFVLLHPLGMICTDATSRAPYGPLSMDAPHPRAYGTFGRFFRDYVKERPLMRIEEGVRKATSVPCETFGLRGRGRVAEGYFADLLVINWPEFFDRSDFVQPHQYCDGIDAIIVNGALTVFAGKQTGRRAGRVLRRID